MNDCICELCGGSVFDAARRGAYLKRVNEKGVDGIWQCRPTCDRVTGTQEDALLQCLDDLESEESKP